MGVILFGCLERSFRSGSHDAVGIMAVTGVDGRGPQGVLATRPVTLGAFVPVAKTKNDGHMQPLVS